VVTSPLQLWLVLAKIEKLHKDTLKYLHDTMQVGGEPVRLVEHRAEIAAEKFKDERDRKAYLQEEMRRRVTQAIG
jgi:hypothetical protein